jgi:hypothetical protein
MRNFSQLPLPNAWAASVTCCARPATTLDTVTGWATKPGITDGVAAKAAPLFDSFDSISALSGSDEVASQ